jgi:hypothetical protein
VRVSDRLLSGRIEVAFGSLGWKAIKANAGKGYSQTRLSRPPGIPAAAPGRNYKAWHGVHYRAAEPADSAPRSGLPRDIAGESQTAQTVSPAQSKESAPSRRDPDMPFVAFVPGQSNAVGVPAPDSTAPDPYLDPPPPPVGRAPRSGMQPGCTGYSAVAEGCWQHPRDPSTMIWRAGTCPGSRPRKWCMG